MLTNEMTGYFTCRDDSIPSDKLHLVQCSHVQGMDDFARVTAATSVWKLEFKIVITQNVIEESSSGKSCIDKQDARERKKRKIPEILISILKCIKHAVLTTLTGEDYPLFCSNFCKQVFSICCRRMPLVTMVTIGYHGYHDCLSLCISASHPAYSFCFEIIINRLYACYMESTAFLDPFWALLNDVDLGHSSTLQPLTLD